MEEIRVHWSESKTDLSYEMATLADVLHPHTQRYQGKSLNGKPRE